MPAEAAHPVEAVHPGREVAGPVGEDGVLGQLLAQPDDDLGEVDVRVVVQDVGGGGGPTFVEENVLEAEVGGEVELVSRLW